MSSLASLPDSARLWIFALNRQLSTADKERIEPKLNRFIAEWTAHGAKVGGGYEIRYDRFILVGADDSAEVSGCSIDSMYRAVRSALVECGITPSELGMITFKDGDEVREVSRAEFRELAAKGEVGPETSVFDNTIHSLGELRSGRWEVKAVDTWHKAFLNAA